MSIDRRKTGRRMLDARFFSERGRSEYNYFAVMIIFFNDGGFGDWIYWCVWIFGSCYTILTNL